MSDYDIIIAGAGHNGLACGCLLAMEGLNVCVLERNDVIGGSTVTREVTLPGFKHDLYGSSMVWIHANPEFNKLLPHLQKHGLELLYEEDTITGHPNRHEGHGIIVFKNAEKTCETIAQYSSKDAKRYQEICDDFKNIEEGVIKGMFSPPAPPSYMAQAFENSYEGLRRLREFSLSTVNFIKENFENDHVKAFMLNWGLAPQIFPDDENAGQSFYVLIPGIHRFGACVPKGGIIELPKSMMKFIESKGGHIKVSSPISQFIVTNGECKGVRLKSGEEILATKGIVTSLGPKVSFLDLMDQEVLDDDFIKQVKNYMYSPVSICRVHYALKEAPIFKNGQTMGQCAFHRIVDTYDELMNQYIEIAAGKAPTNPFVWSACWSQLDRSRVPESGGQTLIADTFVPYRLKNGDNWANIKKEYTDNVLLKVLQQHTTNMDKSNILGEFIHTGVELEKDNPCFVEGDTTGGIRKIAQMGYNRPFPGYSQYKSPIKKLYMTGASTHPGGGITAMGTVTAKSILQDLQSKGLI